MIDFPVRSHKGFIQDVVTVVKFEFTKYEAKSETFPYRNVNSLISNFKIEGLPLDDHVCNTF